MTIKACKKGGKKHTPITSKSQFGAFGSAYGAKKAGKGKPSKTPSSIWKMPMAELERHLEEAGGKKLPKRVKPKKGKKRSKPSMWSGIK